MIEVIAPKFTSRLLESYAALDGDMFVLPGTNSILLVHESSYVTLLQPGAVRPVKRGIFADYRHLVAIPITKLSITVS